MSSVTATLPRIEVRAKFFFEGDKKFVLQGVTYGPLNPRTPGGPCFATPEETVRDFDLMGGLGGTTVRSDNTPPSCFRDLAARRRIRLLLTMPWVKRVLF